MTETAFQRKLRERREAEAAAQPAEPAAPDTSEYADLVPGEDTAYERSDADLTIDRLIDGLDILKAYDLFIPKKRPPNNGRRREGIMVRCPRPDHADNNPSAWVNLDKQTWFCGGCNEGGDKLDLASFYFGMGDYKNGKRFGELRERIAEALGYKVVHAPGVTNPPVVPSGAATFVADPEPTPVPAPTPPAPPPPVPTPVPSTTPASAPAPAPTRDPDAPIAKVVAIFGDDDGEDIKLPSLDWRPLVAPQTFLDVYMRQTTIDDVPEEYHFWNGILAISMACGRDVRLYDAVPVLGNLFVCIIGRTGSGKSRASSHVGQLLAKALPYDYSDPMDRGVTQIVTPGSAEHLIHQFSRPIPDPHNPKVTLGYAPIRGLVEFNELSALVGRAGRSGSILKPILMDFFDGKQLITNGSITSGAQIAENAFASCLTTVQPKAIPKLLNQGDADSGFLNRWIFVSGTPKKRVAIGGSIIDLNPCWEPLKAIHRWAEGKGTIGWTDEGAAAFTRLFDERIERLVATDDTGLFGRIDLLCKKLCLLFAANEMVDAVTESIVAKVEKIFEYLLEIFGVQQQALGQTDARMCQDRIIDLLQRKASDFKDGGVPLNYIEKILTKKYDRELISDSLSLLSKLHIIDSYVPPVKSGPGRPNTIPRYRVVSDAE